jgi:4-hydroxyphenylacetate 3-monooxygenase
MTARTGAAYIAGLRENPSAISMQGEQVKDVTTYPGLRNGVHTLARLYDMQHDPALRDVMTYVSPTTGDRVGLLFITPRTRPGQHLGDDPVDISIPQELETVPCWSRHGAVT